MIHFETYNVHVYKQVTSPWTEEQEDESATLVEDDVLCGLLEAVTVLYLKQRGPLARDLVVGVQIPYAPEEKDYRRPFMTASLLDTDMLPLLRQMLDDLDAAASGSASNQASKKANPKPGGGGADVVLLRPAREGMAK